MQVRVSQEIGTLLDDAVAVSLRRGKYYVGVEHLYEAVLSSVLMLPVRFVDRHFDVLERARALVNSNAWAGVPPTAEGEPYYTPR